MFSSFSKLVVSQIVVRHHQVIPIGAEKKTALLE